MKLKIQVTQKGALYSSECDKCGATIWSHEWATYEHNEFRDAMEQGTAHCPECSGKSNPSTFSYVGDYYAARYAVSDDIAAAWFYGKNERALIRSVREFRNNLGF